MAFLPASSVPTTSASDELDPRAVLGRRPHVGVERLEGALVEVGVPVELDQVVAGPRTSENGAGPAPVSRIPPRRRRASLAIVSASAQAWAWPWSSASAVEFPVVESALDDHLAAVEVVDLVEVVEEDLLDLVGHLGQGGAGRLGLGRELLAVGRGREQRVGRG